MSEHKYTYRFPRPALTTDAVVFGWERGTDALQVLLIERKHDPFAGRWAFPGGFVEEHEPLEQGASRELMEETNLSGIELAQFRAFGEPGRDPRGWTVSVAFVAVVDPLRHVATGGDDAVDARWFPLADTPPLAFDHADILAYALDYVERHPWQPAMTQALGERFASHELHAWLKALRNAGNNNSVLIARGLVTPNPGEDSYRFGPRAHKDVAKYGSIAKMDITENDALIVVDVQNDFCPGGALAVAEGDDVIPIINDLTPRFPHVVYTRDWHPPDHCSFSADPQMKDMSWPVHCVQDTQGAEFRPGLQVPQDAHVVSKGDDAQREAYSGFQDSGLAEDLRGRGVRRVFITGLATDYCVKNTALDACKEGFETIVLEDAVRGVDVPPGSAADALEAMREAGAQIRTSPEVAA